MADVEYLRSLLGVHPDFPKKVQLYRLSPFLQLIV
jgi:hypothetical protein